MERERELPACLAAIPFGAALHLALAAVCCARTQDIERLRNHVERELYASMCAKDYVAVLHYIYGAEVEDAPAA
jgi:hypothetical protein